MFGIFSEFDNVGCGGGTAETEDQGMMMMNVIEEEGVFWHCQRSSFCTAYFVLSPYTIILSMPEYFFCSVLCFTWEQCAVSGVVCADKCPGINVWTSDSGGEFQSGEF